MIEKITQGMFPPEVAHTYNQIMTYFDYDTNVAIFDRCVREHLSPFPKLPKVLELGIGTGHFASRLVKLGYDVVGIDCSPTMIEELRHNYPSLDARLQNVTELDLPGEQFDIVVSPAGPIRFNYFENERVFESYIADWDQTIEAMRRIAKHLRPGGLLVLSQNSDPEQPGYFKSTGDDMKVSETMTYQKRERRDDRFIYKVRKLFECGKELWSIEHCFAWKKSEVAEKQLHDIGFIVLGLDQTNTYHISKIRQ